jgi:hypothetical protein
MEPTEQTLWQIILSGLVGVGLSASCGFRVFVPLLVMGIAVRSGGISPSEGWQWIGSWPALVMFGVATLLEVAGYCVPWLDNVLDTVATPAAVVAGIVATSVCISGWNDPALKWSVAIIAGGGVAAVIQTGTVLVRGASTATTAGVGNFVVSLVELFLSTVGAVLAVLGLPLLCLAIVAGGFFLVRRMLRRRKPGQPGLVAT